MRDQVAGSGTTVIVYTAWGRVNGLPLELLTDVGGLRVVSRAYVPTGAPARWNVRFET